MRFRSCSVGLTLVLSLASSLVAQSPDVQAPTTGIGTAPNLLPAAAPSEAQPVADPLLVQVDEAIRVNGQRYLTANYHSPWQIFHGIVAYRQEFLLKVGDQKMTAINWIATSEPRFDNQPLLLVTQHGAKFHPYTRPYAFEGHPAQSLALLSESHLPVDFQFRVNGRMVTIGDILENTMKEVNTREETTWVLWALINYLKVDATWTNQWGQAWSIETLVQNEVAAHTPTRPCGGNHNLFALSRARDKYLLTGRPLRGVWFEADQKIRQYIEYARSMQNSDGSFSSNFYKGPGFERDMNKRFNTTGHTMEFLAVGLPQERLNEPWVRNAINVLSRELITHKKAPVDCGPLYHSLNALMIYRDRVRPPMSNTLTAEIAKPAAPAPTAVAENPMPTAPNLEVIPTKPAPVADAPQPSAQAVEAETAVPSAESPENARPGIETLQPGRPKVTISEPATGTPAAKPTPTATVVITPIVDATLASKPGRLPVPSREAKALRSEDVLDAAAPRLPVETGKKSQTNDTAPASALEVQNRR